ncbi:pep-cterm exosortase interaction domain protein [Leptolyngbya sp. Heron Island J]|uniref:PEP-CTERM sorting domain-containing protein n=1 Tax=Leptolyngbya sp. Heron Island J TaxID=1385935 RepID=UPI0003B9C5DE|nr:PEP-CTERM sorting domain-containing protein [Leptolyngbya sp. Heron Island J]ESA35252.1 pep-cterm exosortase interaction domain protein [Leptolyngbya sp. Heron Island J]
MNATYKISAIALGGMACTVLASLPATAITFVSDRSALQGTDSLDWSSLGRVFTGVPDPNVFLGDSFTATTESGLGLTVEIPATTNPAILPPFVFQTLSGGIETNFADGDFILFTGLLPAPPPAPGNPGPVTLIFDQPVAAVGSQIAVDDIFSFTGFISAFDIDGNLLDTFSAPGSSSLALDNSAAFFGVASDEANIARVAFSSSVSTSAIGINALSLVPGTTTSVPEPATTVALLLGCGLMVGYRKTLA